MNIDLDKELKERNLELISDYTNCYTMTTFKCIKCGHSITICIITY